jgi:hypothetical protein
MVSGLLKSLLGPELLLLATERCDVRSVALSVSLQILDLSLKLLTNLGPIYRENYGEDVEKQL